jgi:hypothetical protein
MSHGLLTSSTTVPSQGAGLVSPPRCDRRALSEPPPVLAGGSDIRTPSFSGQDILTASANVARGRTPAY